jgi:putative transposase
MIATAKLLGSNGAKTVVTDSLFMKQQLLFINRSQRHASNLSVPDQFLLGSCSQLLYPHHIQQAALIIRPSTLLKFHNLLKLRKYRQLYTSVHKGEPVLKGPSRELIQAIVEMKRRNPRFGCARIAQQINKAFGIDIDKEACPRHTLPAWFL